MADKKQNEHPGLAAVRAILSQASVGLAAPDPQTPFFGGRYDGGPAASAQTEAPAPLSAEELLDECRQEPETDIGNARRLLIRYGDRILFVARVAWHGFDGKRWKEDEDGSIIRPLAQRTAEFILDEAVLLDADDEEQHAIAAGNEAVKDLKELSLAIRSRGKDDRQPSAEEGGRIEALERLIAEGEEKAKAVAGRESARYRHAKSTASTAKINNMLTEAAPHCATVVGDLNRDRLALNCASGTLRFYEMEDEESDPDDPRMVWRIRSDNHDPRDLITKLSPYSAPRLSPDGVLPDWQKMAPNFDKFLKTVQPDPEIRAFLQRFFGYCLTGLTVEQCLVFFYGAGRNGKSTLVDLLVEVFGDYAVTLSIDSFAGESRRGGAEATPDLARLPGARFVSASEPEMGVKLKDALIKALTGGEKIPVRRLHQDFIEVDPQFKIVLSGNHKPRIDDTSDGIWRRVHLVPFDIQIPKDQVDRTLPQKLRKEAAGIFVWLLAGALEYLNFGLNPPPQVISATQEYREESDPIGSFIRASCIVTGKEEDFELPGTLFTAYSAWAAREGAAEFKQNTFARRFPDYTRKTWEGPDGRMHAFWKAKLGTTVYRGLKLREDAITPDAPSYPEHYGG